MTEPSIAYQVPNKGLVMVSLDEATWPKDVGATGYVPRWACVPDPNQCRLPEDFDPASLKELGQSIKINSQLERMHVRLLTTQERETYRLPDERKPFYMLVSGERRWRSMGPEPEMADIPIVKIEVEVYKSRKEQFRDGLIINLEHEGLPPRSVARAFERELKDSCDGKVSELARVVRRSEENVRMYLRINNLIPEAAAFLDPKLPKGQSMGVTLAGSLAKFSHEEQRRLIKPLMVTGEAGKTMGQRMQWLEDQIMRDGTHNTSRKADLPQENRRRLDRLLTETRISGGFLLGAPDQAFMSAFRNLDADGTIKLLEELDAAESTIKRLRERIVEVTVDRKSFLERNKDRLPGWRLVDYYESGQRHVADIPLSPERYASLKKMKWLGWQRRGEPDPDAQPGDIETASAPTPEVAAEVPPGTAAQQEPECEAPAIPAREDTTVKVSYFSRSGTGRQEQLEQGAYVDLSTYVSLRRGGKLYWQRRNLQPSTAEDIFCEHNKLVFEQARAQA